MKMIALGPDRVAGTTDDVISPFITSGLVVLIESELLEDVIELAHSTIAICAAHQVIQVAHCPSASVCSRLLL